MTNTTSPLKSKNHTVRLLEESDFGFFLSLYQDPELMLLVGKIENENMLKRSFSTSIKLNMRRPFKRLTYCIFKGEKRVGIIALMWPEKGNNQCEIGTIVSRSYLNQGIAYEVMKCLIEVAFCKLGVVRVFAKFSIENEAAYRLVKKLGFIVMATKNNLHHCFIDNN